MTQNEYNTARELSAIELDQVSGGCPCGCGGNGCPNGSPSPGCLPPVPAPPVPEGLQPPGPRTFIHSRFFA